MQDIRLLREQRGLALPAAMGMLIVISIAVVSVVAMTTSNEQSASRSEAQDKALALAEAALERAASVLASAPNPASPAAVGSDSESLEGGTSSYSGMLSGSTWTLTGTGTVPSPTPGAADITRSVSRQFVVNPTAPIWQYNLSDSASGCMTIPSAATVAAPLFVRANLCLSNDGHVTGSPLHVGGTVTVNGSGSIGTSVSPIASANLVGGCTGGSPNPHPCTSADGVYANSITQTPSALAKPPIDLGHWYQNAKPGPVNGCTSGAVPGGFDDDGTLNGLRPTFDLTPSSSYICTVTNDLGVTVGQLSWSPVTRVLDVAGTIFFDGPIQFTNPAAVYQGRATLYSSGAITSPANARLCAVPTCDGVWNPSADLLVLVAGSSTASDGLVLASDVIVQGAAYVVTNFRSSAGAQFWGPVLADQLVLSHESLQTVSVGNLPFGAPGTGTVAAVPGSWRG